MARLRVTVWNEFVQDASDPAVMAVYPLGIHQAIADGIKAGLGDDVVVTTATLDQPEHGLSASVLEGTDVLLWWGHLAHDDVSDAVVEAVHHRVLQGMGFIALHSAQGSKIFRRLMGTTCRLDWRHGDRELVWTVDPNHEIAHGLPQPIAIPEQEMYGEFFDIPAPDELVFISSFSGGEVFRSGCCFYRGNGRIFYFSPGHEEYPIYYRSDIRQVINNAVRWAMPRASSQFALDGGLHREQTAWQRTRPATDSR